jgi:hypothetical protein
MPQTQSAVSKKATSDKGKALLAGQAWQELAVQKAHPMEK